MRLPRFFSFIFRETAYFAIFWISKVSLVLIIWAELYSVLRKNSEHERIKYMRIDKYLKVARIIKRRTVANEACDAGRVSVNGKLIKASYDVKIGDVIEIKMGERVTKIEVTAIVEHVLKNDACGLYKVL